MPLPRVVVLVVGGVVAAHLGEGEVRAHIVLVVTITQEEEEPEPEEEEEEEVEVMEVKVAGVMEVKVGVHMVVVPPIVDQGQEGEEGMGMCLNREIMAMVVKAIR